MEFPRLVFTSPGDQKIDGGSYGYEVTNDQEEYDAAIKAGFFPTVPEAVEAFKNPKKGEIQKE